jgi:hypothetical protein
MQIAPEPSNSIERLQALSSYDILDTESEGAYDDIVRLAWRICGTPVAVMGLVDAERVYRIGGDEFCALLHGDADELDAARAAASVALSEQGEGFSITASHGAVSLPNEVPTATQALRLADERMYANKAGRSRASSRQTHDVLLRMLDERDRDLHT